MKKTVFALMAMTALMASTSAFAADISNDPVCIDLAGNVAKKLVDFAVEPGQPLTGRKVVPFASNQDTVTYMVTWVTKESAPETVIYDVTLKIDGNSCTLDSVQFVSVK